jgi:hypothetical protein
MSDLQLSLLAIGVIVVAGVYLLNWLQERKLRRRLGDAFAAGREDVLLRGGDAVPPAQVRIEPQISVAAEAPAAPAGGGDAAPPAAVPPPVPGFDPLFDYVAGLDAASPLAESALADIRARLDACGKPWRAAGYAAGGWKEAGEGRGYASVRFALQLVDRKGPVEAAALAALCDAVARAAAQHGATAVCPDPQAALRAARELDAFCSEVDVAIGINIVAGEGMVFAAARIRALAEDAGLKLEPDGVFRLRDDRRQPVFTLDNHEPAPFLPERIKSLTTSGLTLLLDVPRVADAEAALDRMFEIGKRLAAELGGRLVDDNRSPLGDASLAKIRRQMQAIHRAMEARGVAAGGERALRLFS